MVRVAVIDESGEPGWKSNLESTLKNASVYKIPMNDPLHFLRIEANQPDVLLFNAPPPPAPGSPNWETYGPIIDVYKSIVRTLGIGKNTVVAWSGPSNASIESFFQREFGEVGVPTTQIGIKGPIEALKKVVAGIGRN